MDVYKVSDSTKQEIFKLYNTDKEQVERDVEILNEWIKKQPHLPQKMPFDDFFEKILIGTKFRIEIAKQKIDNYFSAKALHPHIYELLLSKNIVPPSENVLTVVALPKLTSNNGRVLYIEITNTDPDAYEFDYFTEMFLLALELDLRYGCCVGVEIVYNVVPLTFDHLKKVNLKKFATLLHLMMESQGMRVMGIYIISPAPFIQIPIAVARKVLKAKMMQRVRVLQSLDEIDQFVPIELLPSDFGGQQPSVQEMRYKYQQLYENNSDYIDGLLNFASNEYKRIGKSHLNGHYDIDEGTFKKLEVD